MPYNMPENFLGRILGAIFGGKGVEMIPKAPKYGPPELDASGQPVMIAKPKSGFSNFLTGFRESEAADRYNLADQALRDAMLRGEWGKNKDVGREKELAATQQRLSAAGDTPIFNPDDRSEFNPLMELATLKRNLNRDKTLTDIALEGTRYVKERDANTLSSETSKYGMKRLSAVGPSAIELERQQTENQLGQLPLADRLARAQLQSGYEDTLAPRLVPVQAGTALVERVTNPDGTTSFKPRFTSEIPTLGLTQARTESANLQNALTWMLLGQNPDFAKMLQSGMGQGMGIPGLQSRTNAAPLTAGRPGILNSQVIMSKDGSQAYRLVQSPTGETILEPITK